MSEIATALSRLSAGLEWLSTNTETYSGGVVQRGAAASEDMIRQAERSLGRSIGGYADILRVADGYRFVTPAQDTHIGLFSCRELSGPPAERAARVAVADGQEAPAGALAIGAVGQSVAFLGRSGAVTVRTVGEDDESFDNLVAYLDDVHQSVNDTYEFEIEADASDRRKAALEESGQALHSLLAAVAVSGSSLWTISNRAFRWRVEAQNTTLVDSWELPNGTTCASGSPDRAWVATGGKLGIALWPATGSPHPLAQVAISNGIRRLAWLDETTLAVATQLRELALWRRGQSEPDFISPQQDVEITSMVADGTRVWFGQGNKLAVFSPADKTTRHVELSSTIVALAHSPSRVVAIGSDSKLYALAKEQLDVLEVATLPRQVRILDAAFSPDGSTLAISYAGARADRVTALHSLQPLSAPRELEPKKEGMVTCRRSGGPLAWDPSGSWLSAANAFRPSEKLNMWTPAGQTD